MQNLQLRTKTISTVRTCTRWCPRNGPTKENASEKQHGQAILSTKLIQEIHGNSRLRRIILDRPGMSRLRKKPGFIYTIYNYLVGGFNPTEKSARTDRCWGVIFRMALVKGYRFTWGGGGIFRPKPPVFDRS